MWAEFTPNRGLQSGRPVISAADLGFEPECHRNNDQPGTADLIRRTDGRTASWLYR